MSQTPDLLANPKSDRVRQVRALTTRAGRRRAANYLVEGPQGVREVIAFHPADVREVFISPEAAGRYGEIATAALETGLRVRWASKAVLDAMSPDAQGLLAVARIRETTLAAALETAAVPAATGSPPRLVAVLNNARDPGNVGTVIRAADAAGADAVVLTGASVELHNPKLVRATAGSLFHLPVVVEPSLPAALAALRAAGLRVYAADVSGERSLFDAHDPDGPGLSRPTAWLFGNEAWGLNDAELAQADEVLRVPIFGAAESLNLAMAATVCLYASAGHLRAKPMSEAPAMLYRERNRGER